jgi:hypothetical protein
MLGEHENIKNRFQPVLVGSKCMAKRDINGR